MSENSTVVKLPRRWTTGFVVVGGAVGLGAAFLVHPVLDWLLGRIGDAPGVLRLAGELPLAWSIPVLTVLGLVAGLVIAAGWDEGLGEVAVSSAGVAVRRKGKRRFVSRESIAAAYMDRDELILADAHGRELLRSASDGVLASRLSTAFEQHSLPWQGAGDPYESEYRDWVDGDGSLGDEADELLRSRSYALEDKRLGAAAEARDALLDLGIVVRDREGAQQYRRPAAG